MASTTRGEHVYECDTCIRKIRVPENKQGLDVLPNCNITLGCMGKLRRIFNTREVNLTPAVPPEVPGVEDWFQRRVMYTHTQQIADTDWLIEHNLANKPVIHPYVYKVIDNAEVLVTGEPLSIATVDSNTTLVKFATPEAGSAQCISLTTQNITNPDATTYTPVAADTVQLSSNAGVITIATLNDTPMVNVTLSYLTQTGVTTIDYIGVDDIVSIESPWVNAKQAIIAGRKYTLRSFNLTTSPLAPTAFSQGLIPNGTGFYVSAINHVAPTPGQVLFLLGKAPYASVDRVLDKYIDAYYVDKTSPQTLYNSGIGTVCPSIIKLTYPPILVVS